MRALTSAVVSLCLGLGLLVAIAAPMAPGGHRPPGVAGQAGTPPPDAAPAFHGDLAQLKSRGAVRVLYVRAPGAQSVSPTERELIGEYLRSQALRPIWRTLEQEWQAAEELAAGRADIVLSARPSLAAGVSREVDFTLGWGTEREQLVGNGDADRIRSPEDLKTRQVAVKRSSPAWISLQRQSQQWPTMDLILIPEDETAETTLARVETGEYDLAVMNSRALRTHLDGFSDARVIFDLTDARSLAWAVRADATELRDSLNRFLNQKHLELRYAANYREDLPALQKRRLLRLITYQSPFNYFFDNGRLKGFDYELARRFAEKHNMRLDVVIADSHEQMRELLLEGRGDMIAASLPRQSYPGDDAVQYSQPYAWAAPVVVGRSESPRLLDARDLDGRRLVLSAESPYFNAVRRLQSAGIDVELVEADAGVNTEATLFGVAQGMYDLTLVGSHAVNAELERQLGLQAHFPLTEPRPLAWAVRRGDSQLMSAVNEYIETQYRKGLYNVLHARYVENPGRHKGDARLLAQVDRLSPYDGEVRAISDRYGFDWRLIVAQMYQESRFNPDAISYAGAEGLMQILPATAELLGVNDLNDPRASIRGGIQYLDYLRDQFEDGLLPEDRTWFSLASYNAGYGRVQRARNLAVEMGLDRNKWFDNVEQAMLRLAEPYWRDGEMVRNCRCGQTVVYVREIRTLYDNYLRLTQSLRTADAGPAPDQDI